MKTRAKILFVLVFLLILGFIFLLPHGRYRHELEAYKKQLVAKGEKLTIAELAPPPSTNPSNGAKAFLSIMAGYRVPYDYPTNMIYVAPGLDEVGFNNGAPNLTSNYTVNCELMAQLRKVLESPVLQFTVDYSQGFDVPLPHLAQLKSAELLVTITMTQALRANDFPEAQSDLLAAVNLISLSTNEPFIISGLVRAAMGQIAYSATWEALQSNTWTDLQLAELQTKWQSMEFFSNAPATMAFERACGIAEMAKLRLAPNPDNLVLVNPTFSTGSPANGNLLDKVAYEFRLMYNHIRFSRWKSSWSFDEELYMMELEEAVLEASQRASSSGAFVPAIQTCYQATSNINERNPDASQHYLLLTLDESGSFENSLRKLAITETGRRICVTAIALKRYHVQHGAYPTMLNDLVPAYLSAVPIDFMDGKPLRYKLRPDGDFLLYSVGMDGVDDGGDPRPLPPSLSKSWLDGRDIVWPRVATPVALEEYHRLSQSATNAPGK